VEGANFGTSNKFVETKRIKRKTIKLTNCTSQNNLTKRCQKYGIIID
jgi:hypothetical protein